MSKIMNIAPKKTTLKIDGKSFSIERLARALVLQEHELDLDTEKFLKELNLEIIKVKNQTGLTAQ